MQDTRWDHIMEAPTEEEYWNRIASLDPQSLGKSYNNPLAYAAKKYAKANRSVFKLEMDAIKKRPW